MAASLNTIHTQGFVHTPTDPSLGAESTFIGLLAVKHGYTHLQGIQVRVERDALSGWGCSISGWRISKSLNHKVRWDAIHDGPIVHVGDFLLNLFRRASHHPRTQVMAGPIS